MSDSIKIAFKNICGAHLEKIHDALTTSVSCRKHGQEFYVTSPLTEASYAVRICRARFSKKLREDCLLASVNVPACTVGNNVLIQNRVFSACKLVIEMLRYQLAKMNLDAVIVDKINLQNAHLAEVTLTYLFHCANHQAALSVLNDLSLRGEALHNSCIPKGKEFPVYRVGQSEDFTAYFRDRRFQISAYVKSGPTANCFSHFTDEHIQSRIYAEGEKILRVEVRIFDAMLSEHKYSSPYNWLKGSGQSNPYEFGFAAIRKYFRLDDQLRERRLKPDDLAAFSAIEQEILKAHFDGLNARFHPSVVGDSKKFSVLKCALFRKARVDITIPWQRQQRISGYLSATLSFSNCYRIPKALQKYSFSKKSALLLLRRLKRMNSEQQSTRISDDDELDLNLGFD